MIYLIITIYRRTSNNSIHHIFAFFERKYKFAKITMVGGDSPHSSSTKIKLIASVVAEKNIFLDIHLYDHLKLGRL